MSNIYNLNNNVFRFELYNLNYFKDCDTEISGHYRFWYSKKSNKFVFAKHGDYHNLVSIKPVKEDPRFPTGVEKEFLFELVYKKTIKHAYFYDQNASLNQGRYLLDELEEKCVRNPDWNSYWFRNEDDTYYSVSKDHCIFDVDYPGPDYDSDKEYWNNLKLADKKAIDLLG